MLNNLTRLGKKESAIPAALKFNSPRILSDIPGRISFDLRTISLQRYLSRQAFALFRKRKEGKKNTSGIATRAKRNELQIYRRISVPPSTGPLWFHHCFLAKHTTPPCLPFEKKKENQILETICISSKKGSGSTLVLETKALSCIKRMFPIKPRPVVIRWRAVWFHMGHRESGLGWLTSDCRKSLEPRESWWPRENTIKIIRLCHDTHDSSPQLDGSLTCQDSIDKPVLVGWGRPPLTSRSSSSSPRTFSKVFHFFRNSSHLEKNFHR